MAPHQPTPVRQTISVTVIVSGEQDTKIDSHATGPGSYVSMSTPSTMITLHSREAVTTYVGAWADAAGSAVYLPASRPVQIEHVADRVPGVVVAAHRADQVRTVYSPTRRELMIRVGYLNWVCTDKDAYGSLLAAWTAVARFAEIALPRW